jgi:hypothetical protein
MKILIILISLTLASFSLSSKSKSYSMAFSRKSLIHKSMASALQKKDTFDVNQILKFIQNFLAAIEFKMVKSELSCSQNGNLPNFEDLGIFGTTFGPLFKQLTNQNTTYTQCFGSYKFSNYDDVRSRLNSNVAVCERLPLYYQKFLSYIAYDLGNDRSICAAFDNKGTFAITVSSGAVKTLKVDNNPLSILNILIGYSQMLQNQPIDLGFSFNRHLQMTSRLADYISYEVDELSTEKTSLSDSQAITSYKKTVYEMSMKDVTHRGNLFLYLPQNLNILSYFKGIDNNIKNAIQINANIPVLIDFGPMSTVFGKLPPGLIDAISNKSGSQLISGVASTATNLLTSGFNTFFTGNFQGIEFLLKVSGELKINIPGFPITVKTDDVMIFIKSHDIDYGNGMSKKGLYITLPPKAHKQFHDFLRKKLEFFKIYLPKEPSTEIGLMFTDRFGIVMDIKDIGVTWKCSVPWGGNLFLSPDCGIYIR